MFSSKCKIFALQIHHIYARAYAREVAVTAPPELDILQKYFCLRKGY